MKKGFFSGHVLDNNYWIHPKGRILLCGDSLVLEGRSRTHAGGGGCWAEWNYGRQGLLGPMELRGAEAVGPDGIKGVWLHVEKTRNNGLQHLHSTNYSYESINRSIQINSYLTMGSVDFICVAKFYQPNFIFH